MENFHSMHFNITKLNVNCTDGFINKKIAWDWLYSCHECSLEYEWAGSDIFCIGSWLR